MRYSRLAVILNVILISGCTTMSQDQFETAQKRLAADPALRKVAHDKAMKACIAQMDLALKKSDVEAAATLFDANPATVRRDLCERVERSYASGKMTYADYREVMEGRITARSIRIMRGKL
jgi:hypothetical protein